MAAFFVQAFFNGGSARAGFDARFARVVADVQAGLQPCEREFFVAVLRAVFGGDDRNARGQVGCADGGLHFVAVLTARAGCAQGLELNVLEEGFGVCTHGEKSIRRGPRGGGLRPWHCRFGILAVGWT